LALTGYVRERLSFPRTVLAQLPRPLRRSVTPPASGGLAVNIRYLRKAGLSPAGPRPAWRSARWPTRSYFVLLVASRGDRRVLAAQRPDPELGVIVIGGLIVVLLIALAVPTLRRCYSRTVAAAARGAASPARLVTSPIKLAEALLGSLLLNAAYISALWCAVRAFDAAPRTGVAVVYLAGAAIGSAAPTPAGSAPSRVRCRPGSRRPHASAAAISAVLMYRIATFWLPVRSAGPRAVPAVAQRALAAAPDAAGPA